MLHMFLVILKMIGILLAVILGITLLLILCVLFWPIRYSVKGQNKDGWDLKARIGFLGPLIRFTICYRENMEYKLRILGISFWQSKTSKQKEKEHTRNQTKKSARKKKEKSIGKHKKNRNILDEEEEWNQPEAPVNSHLLQDSGKEEMKPDSLKQEKQTQEKNEYDNQDGFIRRYWNRVKAKIQAFSRMIRSFSKYLSKIKQIFGDEGVHRGYTSLKAELFLLLGKIKPRKISWYLKFGFEDPASTGQLLGLLAVIKGFSGYDIQVEPDFEHKILETDFSIKGFIQGFRLLRTGWKCLFDEDIKYLFGKLRLKEE